MKRPEFALRGPEEIVLVDRDGKETPLTLYELLMLVGQGALVAQLATGPPKPGDNITPFHSPRR